MVDSCAVPAARKSYQAPFAQGSPKMSDPTEYGARYASPTRSSSSSKRRPETAPVEEVGSWAGSGIPIDSLLLPWKPPSRGGNHSSAAVGNDASTAQGGKAKPLPHVVSFTPDGLLDVEKLISAATKPRADLDAGGAAAAKGRLGQEPYIRHRGKGIQPVSTPPLPLPLLPR